MTKFTEKQLQDMGLVQGSDGNYYKPIATMIDGKITAKYPNGQKFKVEISSKPQLFKNDRKKWNQEEIAKLIELYKEKRPIDEMVKIFGRKRKSIINKAYSLKITDNPDYSEDEKQTIIYYYTEVSKSNPEFLIPLSKLLNRPKSNICRFAKRLGLTEYGRKETYIKICLNCGKEMIIKGSKNSKKDTCSKKCLSEWSSKRVIKYIETKGHPKGMLGKTHTEENRRKHIS